MHKTNSQRESAREFVRAVLGTILGSILRNGLPRASPAGRLRITIRISSAILARRGLSPDSEKRRIGVGTGLSCLILRCTNSQDFTDNSLCTNSVYTYTYHVSRICMRERATNHNPSERWRTIWRVRLAKMRRLPGDGNEVLASPKRGQLGAGFPVLFRTLTLQLLLPGPLLSTLQTDVSRGSNHLRHLDTTNAVVPGVSLCVCV